MTNKNRKYELVIDDTATTENGVTLYRIRALRSFGDVKAGDLGGYVQSEDNLDHDGDCWVYGNARVYNRARVSDNARVFGGARVYGSAWVSDNVWVYDDARVYGSVWVYDDARVYNSAWVYGSAEVYGSAWVSDNVWVHTRARVFGEGEGVPRPSEDETKREPVTDTDAKRFNSGKVDLSFIPSEATFEECKVWSLGEKKYGRDNWKNLWGDKTINVACASALRHMMSMLEGEMLDKESGCAHAAHVRCNMAMILLYLSRQKIIDVKKVPELKFLEETDDKQVGPDASKDPVDLSKTTFYQIGKL